MTMEDYVPYEFTDDDDTEELPPREVYKPPVTKDEPDLDFPDYSLFQ